ncbi:hypothetical protein [Streptomyces sp. NPDC017958]|uniref:hypothetical protein n=1 Tax=Streptomyces sp. NPDC017958 TaxID=3365021 RepID=UPI0037B66AF6
MPEEGFQVVGLWLGNVGQPGRCVQWVEAFNGGRCPADPFLGFGSGLARRHVLDSRAYGAHVLGQSGGVSPCRFLGFEVPDAVRLCVPDAGLFHGGFPADALLACRFGLVLTSAFGGLAAQRDLLCDLGELLFEGKAGGVSIGACRTGVITILTVRTARYRLRDKPSAEKERA